MGTKGLSKMFMHFLSVPWLTMEPRASTMMRNAINDVMSFQYRQWWGVRWLGKEYTQLM